ncbi:plastocyanin/azurin family copper-binding protein [Magnetospirillum sp. UT-4]|uniref:cupredoxin domain-containing protein n=1 Tax=Magnetospirillum sp. UT-4 TaxID=2681467 RepID=UPI0013810876|nr:plastocyanin/azurin family copper-binding protein [Magnetospirillum sp. UT-4]CAA7624255.1 Plastocyanin [Magnetospirillum sp. UT-4]
MTRAAALAVVLLWAVPADAAETARVGIDRMRFQPAAVTVKAGTTVAWVNDEKRTSHSVFFETEGLAESERLLPGDSWQRKFERPGRYAYRCGPHPEMIGVVEVVP